VKIGIYLPTHLPGVSVQEARLWAQRAEELAFDTLVMTNRMATDAPDPLMLATAVTMATGRIGLLGDVSYGPGWTARAHAEHSAGLDRASGGRFTSALTFPASDVSGPGLSEGDSSRSGAATLAEIHRHWRATLPARRTLPLLIGGNAGQAATWVAGHADGWLMRAGTPDQLASGAARITRAWADAGRAGCPTVAAAFHYALGADADRATETLQARYRMTVGRDHARDLIAGSAVDMAEISLRIAEFSAAGADLVLAIPATSDLTQLTGLAAAAAHPVHA
jgi:alkanesulfonate monooxygenase SsuD/methylene tetrahydromethanopterin reductase-like flavin-dependent oxidoreductase (luciferase family)